MRLSMFAVALHIAVCLSLPHPAALAQDPQPPTDSVPADSLGKVARDSVPADSVRHGPIHPWWGPLILPITVAFALVMSAAPAPLARWVNIPKTLTFMKDHAALHASVGGRFTEGETWANALSIELVGNGVYGELRAEDFWRPRHVRYLTARTGYLWHPKSAAAGGLTVGYVHAEGITAQTGLEIGLPLFIGGKTVTMRFEPTYVVSSAGLLWSYRAQTEAYVGGGRYVLGANVVQKSLSLSCEDDKALAPQAVTVVVGLRF